MDITLKNLPTKQIADRVIGVARNLVDAYLEEQAKALTEEAETTLKSEKDAWRTANDLPTEFTAVEPEEG